MITTLSRSSSTQFPLLTLTKKGEGRDPDLQPANAGLLLMSGVMSGVTNTGGCSGWMVVITQGPHHRQDKSATKRPHGACDFSD